MNKPRVQLSFGAALIVVLLVLPSIESKPSYVECLSGEECGAGRCCMLGMNRYSTPTCLPMSSVNEPCRPFDQRPHNLTLSYPDGAEVGLTGVHRQFCPCLSGLYCNLNTFTCAEPDTLDNEIPTFFN